MADTGKIQPLFPEAAVAGPLLALAADVIRASHLVSGKADGHVAHALSPWLRAMNSYYTNKIEGQHTRPVDIERALHHQFDADVAMAKKQRVAIAHMDAEAALELQGVSARDWFASIRVAEIHASLYSKLPAGDRITDDGEPIVPGEFRLKDVTAGRHLAPAWRDVPPLLDTWAARYSQLEGNEALLVGIACAHHRLAWIHPFIDGNGRTARLHSHLTLQAMGLTQGLWSPMRGLARTQELYYARLNNADLPRRNDLDGRGALSQEGLIAFVRYFLETCLDQSRFMGECLSLPRFQERIAALLGHLQSHPWQLGSEKSLVKLDAVEALHYVSITGPVERSRFVAMTGLGDRTGRRVLASLLDFGILSAPSHRAPVSFSLPLKSLRFLFPRLWPEAEVD